MFIGSGPNSRTSQLFISYGDIEALGKELWETPFGEVIEGMEHVEELYSYGDMPPWGKGPVQQKIRNDPNYIPNEFPLLDKFETCTVEIHKPTKAPKETEAAAAVNVEAERKMQVETEVEKSSGVTDDPVELEQREKEAEEEAQEALGPFEDLMQVGAVVSAVIVVVLLLAALARRKGKNTRYKD